MLHRNVARCGNETHHIISPQCNDAVGRREGHVESETCTHICNAPHEAPGGRRVGACVLCDLNAHSVFDEEYTHVVDNPCLFDRQVSATNIHTTTTHPYKEPHQLQTQQQNHQQPIYTNEHPEHKNNPSLHTYTNNPSI